MTQTMQQIISICNDKGVKQRELAEKTGHTEATISRWFRGERTPSIRNVEEMLYALGCCLYIKKDW